LNKELLTSISSIFFYALSSVEPDLVIVFGQQAFIGTFGDSGILSCIHISLCLIVLKILGRKIAEVQHSFACVEKTTND